MCCVLIADGLKTAAAPPPLGLHLAAHAFSNLEIVTRE